MGLLDDAIREHLDLKRRRGADPAEVERAEHEALGPVRRAPQETAPDELDHGPEAEQEPYESDSIGESDEEPDLVAPAATGTERIAAAVPPPEPERRRPAEERREETQEHKVEDPVDREGAPAAEDVLEETPEFLQETPDHDRLWFEQRPPRDFDFDG